MRWQTIVQTVGLVFFSSAAAYAVGRGLASEDRPIAHMVFFTLKERTPENLKKMLDISNKYLTEHDGCLYYSVGTRAEDSEEPVSVKDFDVALHVVFDSKESKDKYLVNKRHTQFVDEGKDLWSQVRVFDSYLVKP